MIRRPTYDPATLRPRILHLGVGAFHRAHQAVFTEDAIEKSGGDWGIVGVAMTKPDVARALSAQSGYYTVETLAAQPSYRVIGCLREALTLPLAPDRVIGRFAETAIISLTVTEKGYCLTGDELDFAHPAIRHDLAQPESPHSAIGVLVAGLAARKKSGGGMTVISCDNLSDNGRKLRHAVIALAERKDHGLAEWIAAEIAFPETMVDCIVPATDAASRQRVAAALGQEDLASVQREPFAQWVIEDRFAGPRPDWDKAGVEIVAAVLPYRRLKLHVLNLCHSALAYLGLPRGHVHVRDAIADPELVGFLDTMIAGEVAPVLAGLPVAEYWRTTLARFTNPAVAHRLDQIAQDGAFKLNQRAAPLMLEHIRAGRPIPCLTRLMRAWMAHDHVGPDGLAGYPDEIRAVLT